MSNHQSIVSRRLVKARKAIALCALLLIVVFAALPAAADTPATPKLRAYVPYAPGSFCRDLCTVHFEWTPCTGCDFYQKRLGQNGGEEVQSHYDRQGSQRKAIQGIQLHDLPKIWVFRVQACNSVFLGPSDCSPWASIDHSQVDWPAPPPPPPSEAELAARRRQEQLRQALAPTQGTNNNQEPYSLAVSPVVLAPATNQGFFAQTPVTIKLAPPKGWSVISYIVTIQKKAPQGNWLPYSSLLVGANQAHSAAGYTGFGAGALPAYISVPGAWRLNVQASYPKQSEWSNWTEFTVRQSPVSTTVKKPGLPPLVR